MHQGVRCAQVAGDAAHLVLHQAGEGRQVAGAVAELGEEAHHRLGGVVGADHQAVVGVGDGELGHHADARLDVAGDEVTARLGQLVQVGDLFGQADHAVGDVHGFFFIGADEIHRHLGVLLVMLDVVGQAHGDEAVARIAGLGAQLLDG
ncbi:hypothetical protein D3C72_1912060 [compost metagenome]